MSLSVALKMVSGISNMIILVGIAGFLFDFKSPVLNYNFPQ